MGFPLFLFSFILHIIYLLFPPTGFLDLLAIFQSLCFRLWFFASFLILELAVPTLSPSPPEARCDWETDLELTLKCPLKPHNSAAWPWANHTASQPVNIRAQTRKWTREVIVKHLYSSLPYKFLFVFLKMQVSVRIHSKNFLSPPCNPHQRQPMLLDSHLTFLSYFNLYTRRLNSFSSLKHMVTHYICYFP